MPAFLTQRVAGAMLRGPRLRDLDANASDMTPPFDWLFISYRREDDPGSVHRLADELRAHFKAVRVVVDDEVEEVGDLLPLIDEADVFISCMGAHWAKNPAGENMLGRDDDWVRQEVVRALTNRVPIMPVLLGEAQMPRRAELPPDFFPELQTPELKDFLHNKALSLWPHRPRWNQDLQRILTKVEEMLSPPGLTWSQAEEGRHGWYAIRLSGEQGKLVATLRKQYLEERTQKGSFYKYLKGVMELEMALPPNSQWAPTRLVASLRRSKQSPPDEELAPPSLAGGDEPQWYWWVALISGIDVSELAPVVAKELLARLHVTEFNTRKDRQWGKELAGADMLIARVRPPPFGPDEDMRFSISLASESLWRMVSHRAPAGPAFRLDLLSRSSNAWSGSDARNRFNIGVVVKGLLVSLGSLGFESGVRGAFTYWAAATKRARA